MKLSPREHFLAYVKGESNLPAVVSPFLPAESVVRDTLTYLGHSPSADAVANEIQLACVLNYEPMFMTELSGLIFPWKVDEKRSDNEFEVAVIPTRKGDWIRRQPRKAISWNEDAPCPVQTEKDHEYLVLVCEQIADREPEIRQYYREWRQRVGEAGVIVIGHPHPSWLGYQINPQQIFYHWADHREWFQRSMDALFQASLFVMSIALEEGIDFMSDSSYGLEMTSPRLFVEMDLPYIQAFAEWTHQRKGLFWYHNCGFTRQFILEGTFNQLGADVIETIAPPPEGDNDLAESRRHIDESICTKGNLNLNLLKEGTPEDIAVATYELVVAVRGYKHIISTADAVLPGTPPENFIAFTQTAREALSVI